MNQLKISDVVKCETAYFVRIQDDCVWYAIQSATIGDIHFDDDWEFPVPLSELEGGIFHAQEKPLLLMRWIRRQVAKYNENLRMRLRWEASQHGLRDVATLTDLIGCPRCGGEHASVEAEVLCAQPSSSRY